MNNSKIRQILSKIKDLKSQINQANKNQLLQNKAEIKKILNTLEKVFIYLKENKLSPLKININGKNYDVECNDGEEDLLKQSVELINDNIEKRNDLKIFPDSKMFMLISLIFAGDLITLKQKIKITDKELDIVDEELDKLKKLYKKMNKSSQEIAFCQKD